MKTIRGFGRSILQNYVKMCKVKLVGTRTKIREELNRVEGSRVLSRVNISTRKTMAKLFRIRL